MRSRSDSERRLRQSVRLARPLHVLTLIQSAGPWHAGDLAAELECSVRSIYRDLQVLELAGLPVCHDPRTGYRLLSEARFPVPALTRDEMIGQAVATRLAETPDLRPGRGSETVTRKLAATASLPNKTLLARASDLIAVLDLKLADHRRHQDVIRTIQTALLDHRQLRGVYRSPYEPAPVNLTLHPYRLCLLKQAWYLIARREGAESPRTYRIPRFEPGLALLPIPAEIPESFDLTTYFGLAWAVYRGDSRFEIEVRFSRSAAATVTETIWHRTQEVLRHRDGEVTLNFTVDGLNEIVRWVLGWAGQCRVIRPDELRDLVRTRLEAGLGMVGRP